jgi:hypothetical protein
VFQYVVQPVVVLLEVVVFVSQYEFVDLLVPRDVENPVAVPLVVDLLVFQYVDQLVVQLVNVALLVTNVVLYVVVVE